MKMNSMEDAMAELKNEQSALILYKTVDFTEVFIGVKLSASL
jgi:hypothetical protein